jgi:hypothetical protein
VEYFGNCGIFPGPGSGLCSDIPRDFRLHRHLPHPLANPGDLRGKFDRPRVPLAVAKVIESPGYGVTLVTPPVTENNGARGEPGLTAHWRLNVASIHSSRRTSSAALSSRIPRNAACRSRPCAVHSTNLICTTLKSVSICDRVLFPARRCRVFGHTVPCRARVQSSLTRKA